MINTNEKNNINKRIEKKNFNAIDWSKMSKKDIQIMK